MIIVHMTDGTQQPIEAANWVGNEHWTTFEVNAETKVFIPTARIKMILQVPSPAQVPIAPKEPTDEEHQAAIERAKATMAERATTGGERGKPRPN